MNLYVAANDLQIEAFDWGTLQWLANAQLFPGAAQTLGLCQLRPGMRNPLHYHPNCEEILFVQEGKGKHLLGDTWIDVEPGSVVRIPAKMKHQLINDGKNMMITIIAFSSGERQTVFLE